LAQTPREIDPGTAGATFRPAAPPAAPVADVDPDGALVQRARAGDADAFRGLVERHERKVYGLVMRVLHCDREFARDVCQEVFVRVHRGLLAFEPVARFSTWLHTVTLNHCISEYRKSKALKRSRRTVSLDAPVAGTDDLRIEPVARGLQPADGVHQRDFAAAVREAVHALPEEFRHAVLLRDLQGLSYEEIGEILHVPPGTVRSRIHRGRLILQEQLREFRP
jgi:RNA polymerase sigma-70 factor (ECF subfamily)